MPTHDQKCSALALPLFSDGESDGATLGGTPHHAKSPHSAVLKFQLFQVSPWLPLTFGSATNEITAVCGDVARGKASREGRE